MPKRRRLVLSVALAFVAVGVGAVAVHAGGRGAVRAEPVVFAGQDDDLAVGLAVTPSGRSAVALRATVLGFTGPAAGLKLRFRVDGRSAAAAPCGAGCYAAAVPTDGRPHAAFVHIERRGHAPATLRFALPARWPASGADAIVRRAGTVIRNLHSLVDRSRLASDSRHVVLTTYKIVAPNRLEYRNGDGSGSIIIGDRRWDRTPGGPWLASPQNPPIRQPLPFWPPRFVDAHVLREATLAGKPVWVVSFLDPVTPAWFTIWVDRRDYRTLVVDMIATAHFMHDREGPFNVPLRIVAPR